MYGTRCQSASTCSCCMRYNSGACSISNALQKLRRLVNVWCMNMRSGLTHRQLMALRYLPACWRRSSAPYPSIPLLPTPCAQAAKRQRRFWCFAFGSSSHDLCALRMPRQHKPPPLLQQHQKPVSGMQYLSTQQCPGFLAAKLPLLVKLTMLGKRFVGG